MLKYGMAALLLGLGSGVVAVACESGEPVSPGADAGAGGMSDGDGDAGSGNETSGGGGAVPMGGSGQSGDAAGGQGGEPDVAGGPNIEPFIRDCEGQPLELDADWVRFCVLAGSCVADSIGIATCIQSPGWPAGYYFTSPNAYPPHDEAAPYTGSWDFSDCSKAITSCEDVEACADQVFTTPTETCDQLGEAYCEDDARVYCNPEGLLYKAPPCSLQSNFECTTLQPLNVDDHFLGCVPPGCGDLHGAGSEESCDGDDYTFDDGYLSLRLHCPEYGFATCLEGRCVP